MTCTDCDNTSLDLKACKDLLKRYVQENCDLRSQRDHAWSFIRMADFFWGVFIPLLFLVAVVSMVTWGCR